MEIQTNKVQCTLDYMAISRDFEIRCLKTQNLVTTMQIYSRLFSKYGILSNFEIVKGKYHYLYFLGQRNRFKFTAMINDLKKEDCQDLVTEPYSILLHTKESDYVLVNLLLNYMSNQEALETSDYGNYYGHLFASKVPYEYMPYKKATGGQKNSEITVHKNTILFKRITYTKDATIVVSVESWMPLWQNLDTNKKWFKKLKPVLCLKDGVTSKVLWDTVNEKMKLWKDNPTKEEADRLFSDWYVRGVPNRRVHNSFPFLTIKPFEHYDDKVKVYKDFVVNVNHALSSYIQIHEVPIEVKRYLANNKKAAEKEKNTVCQEAISMIHKKGLVLIYKQYDQYLEAQKLYNALLSNYPDIAKEDLELSQAPNPEAWNLQVVYAPENYIDETGKYNPSRDDYIRNPSICIQHYVIDNGAIETKLPIVLIELLVKDGLLNKHLPATMHTHADVTVVKRYALKGAGNAEYYALSINKDDDITLMYHFNNLGLHHSPFEKEIIQKFEDVDDENAGYLSIRPVEGLIKMNGGAYCSIQKTTLRPIPNYDKMHSDFKQFMAPDGITKGQAIQLLKEYAKVDPAYSELINQIANRFDMSGSSDGISIKQWKKWIQEETQKSNVTKIANFVDKMTKGTIQLCLRTKSEKKDPYQMMNQVGIAYKVQDEFIEYFAGMRGLTNLGDNATQERATIFRRLETDGSLDFEAYAKMLDVSWVRAGVMDATVLPFPFKLLNEYIKNEGNRLILDEVLKGNTPQE